MISKFIGKKIKATFFGTVSVGELHISSKDKSLVFLNNDSGWDAQRIMGEEARGYECGWFISPDDSIFSPIAVIEE